MSVVSRIKINKEKETTVMIKTLNDLPPKVSIYAQHCIEHYSILDLVKKSQNGIPYDEIVKFELTGEQWQDAMFAAIKGLRDK